MECFEALGFRCSRAFVAGEEKVGLGAEAFALQLVRKTLVRLRACGLRAVLVGTTVETIRHWAARAVELSIFGRERKREEERGNTSPRAVSPQPRNKGQLDCTLQQQGGGRQTSGYVGPNFERESRLTSMPPQSEDLRSQVKQACHGQYHMPLGTLACPLGRAGSPVHSTVA